MATFTSSQDYSLQRQIGLKEQKKVRQTFLEREAGFEMISAVSNCLMQLTKFGFMSPSTEVSKKDVFS